MQAYDEKNTPIGDMMKMDGENTDEKINDLAKQDAAETVRIFELIPQLKKNMQTALRKVNVMEYDTTLKSLIIQSLQIAEALEESMKETKQEHKL